MYSIWNFLVVPFFFSYHLSLSQSLNKLKLLIHSSEKLYLFPEQLVLGLYNKPFILGGTDSILDTI